MWGFFPNVGIFRVEWGSIFLEWGLTFKVIFEILTKNVIFPKNIRNILVGILKL